ncbi:MAG: error-prone DNA polymerase [Gammaproteobacteria bacterium]
MAELTNKSPAYAELHCLSNFSFLRGASHPEELVSQAAELGYRALALTDECSLAGVVRAHVTAKALGLKLIIGIEIRINDGPQLVLLATNKQAYAEISALVTCGRRRAEKGSYDIYRDDVQRLIRTAIIIWLPQRDSVSFDPEFSNQSSSQESATRSRDEAEAKWIKQLNAGGCWLGLEQFYQGDDEQNLQRINNIALRYDLSIVACGDVHMHNRQRHALADTLAAIRLGKPLSSLGYAAAKNNERYLRPRSRLEKIYPAAAVAESLVIAERCQFSLDELHYQYPRELVPEHKTPTEHLRLLTEQGLARRWPEGPPEKVVRLVEHELALIAELGYEAFFLTVNDVVMFARSREILCQGRGSAANSAVCYCLGITEVNPAHMEMLFERFISKERNEPPDIDVDFEHDRREEVIQYIYQKYGRERAALAATVITYKARSAVRDVGKALGMSLEQVDRLAKNIFWWDGKKHIPERLCEVGFDPSNPVIKRLMILVSQIIGFPRHLSQHVGGFVISDSPLSDLVPIENAAMPERTIIQWDKNDLEALGLLKVDCLCLGMLSAIRRCFDLIKGFSGEALTMADIPADDAKTYAMIQRADTVGVFQIESRAQMVMLPRLKPKNYYDLVIEVAIIRPGPILGEMVHPYLRRRNGEEPVDYPSEEVRAVLERTLGVPLFQEQVIKIAMVAAGFSGGEADQLRRSMAAWKRNGGLEKFRDKLIDGMRERGYEGEFAERIFNQIQGFGEYGFPESHAASFALLAYVSAWMKCHHPAAFTAALLNSLPMGFYAPAQLVQDARRHQVEVRPVDVRFSDWECCLEPGTDNRWQPALRLGFRLVKGLTETSAQRLCAARAEKAFVNINEMTHRAMLDRRDMNALSRAGALRSMAGNRHQANWETLGVEQPNEIFDYASPNEATPMLRPPTEGEDVIADYASLGLTLGAHPLALLRKSFAAKQYLSADEIMLEQPGSVIKTAGLVIMRQRPGTATGVVFVTLEDETGSINLIVWSSLVELQRRELLGAKLMGVVGEIQREGEVTHIVAKRLFDYTKMLGRLSIDSRDFH